MLPLPEDFQEVAERYNRPWVQAVQAKANPVTQTRAMEFRPSREMEGKCLPKIGKEDVADTTEKWINSLIGQVVESDPPYVYVKNFAKNEWGTCGLLEVQKTEGGMFLFRFQDEKTKMEALEQSPVEIGSKRMAIFFVKQYKW